MLRIDRVMIDQDTAEHPRFASAKGITPVIVFKRDDGWCLAAPANLEQAAYKLYEKEWVEFVRKPSLEFRSIKDYQPLS